LDVVVVPAVVVGFGCGWVLVVIGLRIVQVWFVLVIAVIAVVTIVSVLRVPVIWILIVVRHGRQAGCVGG
jgi:hypothetical protein